MLLAPSVARADLASLKASCRPADALDDRRANAIQIPYRFCDDGVPPVGGRTPNEGAKAAVAVPQRYAGYEKLPPKAAPDPDAGADSDGHIALDVNVALPDRRRHPRPRHGYPLIVLMHGCCDGSKADWHGTIDGPGEKWHYNDAWFASHGYVVLTYTSRGFVDAEGRGSTGEAQMNHREYEVNDLQYLAGLLAEDPFFGVNPERVVVSGGSYGGGLAWMTLTDPNWRSPNRGVRMRLAAVAPRYGWSDLAASLVPNGTPKRSFLLAHYTSGTPGVPPAGAHATFPPEIDQAFACLSSTDPFEANPACGIPLTELAESFIRDRSAYYQDHFFDRIARNRRVRVPVFSAGSLSDQLFPMDEHRRMQAKLRTVAPGYPLEAYYGAYGHAVQNKAKEWGDLCGGDRHVCTFMDYRQGFNRNPRGFTRLGVTTRLNRFIHHYARPPGNRRARRPLPGVTVSLQTCRQNATRQWPLDEPGMRFSAGRLDDLAPHRWVVALPGEGETTSDASPNPHAAEADPVANSLTSATCASHTEPAGEGVAVFDSEELAGDVTMIGQTQLTAEVAGSGGELQLNARLYDLHPDGTQVLVDRGVHTILEPSGTVTLDLHGNAWRFEAGHRIRLELAQDDDPYVRRSAQPGTLEIGGVTLALPIREDAPGMPGDAGPDVMVHVRERAGGRFRVSARPTALERTGIERFEFVVGHDGDYQPLPGAGDSRRRTYMGVQGEVYAFGARAVDARGVPGPWVYASGYAR